MNDPDHLLFVYGTLMPGQANHHVVQNIPGQWFKASTSGRKEKILYGRAEYEALVYQDAGAEIQGYVLVSRVLHQHWDKLDLFEGEKYVRKVITVRVQDGHSLNPVMATAYVKK